MKLTIEEAKTFGDWSFRNLVPEKRDCLSWTHESYKKFQGKLLSHNLTLKFLASRRLICQNKCFSQKRIKWASFFCLDILNFLLIKNWLCHKVSSLKALQLPNRHGRVFSAVLHSIHNFLRLSIIKILDSISLKHALRHKNLIESKNIEYIEYSK